MAVLLRGGKGWMSPTPFEFESQEIGIRFARGHVLVCGLGMGWAASAVAANPGCHRGHRDREGPDVIALHERSISSPACPKRAPSCGGRGRRIRVAPGRSGRPADARHLAAAGQRRTHRRSPADAGQDRRRAIYFWGQELELARHAVAAGRALEDAGIAATIAELGLPLIGPEMPDYAARLDAAARQWLRGRWLPGSPRPW